MNNVEQSLDKLQIHATPCRPEPRPSAMRKIFIVATQNRATNSQLLWQPPLPTDHGQVTLAAFQDDHKAQDVGLRLSVDFGSSASTRAVSGIDPRHVLREHTRVVVETLRFALGQAHQRRQIRESTLADSGLLLPSSCNGNTAPIVCTLTSRRYIMQPSLEMPEPSMEIQPSPFRREPEEPLEFPFPNMDYHSRPQALPTPHAPNNRSSFSLTVQNISELDRLAAPPVEHRDASQLHVSHPWGPRWRDFRRPAHPDVPAIEVVSPTTASSDFESRYSDSTSRSSRFMSSQRPKEEAGEDADAGADAPIPSVEACGHRYRAL